MSQIFTTLMVLACFFTAHGTPVPQEEVEEEVKKDKEEVTPHAYTVPNSTWHYSTIEEILEEIAANKRQQAGGTEGHTINKRALGCAVTDVAYGSNIGSPFVDFTGTHPWPCGVDIVQIKIWHDWFVHAIQMKYKTVDDAIIQKPKHGTNTPRPLSVINLQNGERITGATGMVCAGTPTGTYVRQLAFLSQRDDGQKLIYGPYGDASPTTRTESCQIFSINGKINSIFGKATTLYNINPPNSYNPTVVGAIGFYYEDESRSTQHAN